MFIKHSSRQELTLNYLIAVKDYKTFCLSIGSVQLKELQ